MSSLKFELQNLFSTQPFHSLEESMVHHACVSLLLRGQTLDDLELAFIERAIRPEDRWSGQIAFPGGRRETFDKTHLDAAIRETAEEVNLILEPQEWIGTLSDIQARKRGHLLDFYIRPFVFYVDKEAPFQGANDEVSDFFWIKVKSITAEKNQTTYSQHEEGKLLNFPAVDVQKNLPLWGLSYMITLDLLKILKQT